MNNSLSHSDDIISLAYSMEEVTINIIYTGLLVFIGLFGNAYCIMQLLHSNLNRYALTLYLLSLAVSDSCFLLSLTVLFFYNLGFTILSYPVLCQFTYYISYLSCFLSGWYIVALSTERCIAVYRPLRSYISDSRKRSIVVICAITVVGMVINCWPLFIFERQVTQMIRTNSAVVIHVCEITDSSQHYYTMLSYFDAIVSCFIPITLIIVLNLMIVRRIFVAQSVRNELLNGGNSIKMSCSSHKLVKRRNSSLVNRIRNRDRKVTALLLAIPVVHIILNAPNYLYGLAFTFISSNGKEENPTNSTLEIVLQFIFYSQYSINFVLYSCRNQVFSSRKHGSFRESTFVGKRSIANLKNSVFEKF